MRGYGNNHRFCIEWTAGAEPADYYVVFDMNAGTLLVTDATGDVEDAIRGAAADEAFAEGIYDLQGRRIASSQVRKGLYIINGKKVVIGK